MNTRPMTYGILYVATQKEKYLTEAVASAHSLKHYCPDLPVCVFTDLLDSKIIQNECFDIVKPISNDTECGTVWGRGVRSRILSLPQTPFDRTLHVDTDTRFLSNASQDIVNLLDEYDIAMVEDPPNYSIDVQQYGSAMYNVGVMLYRTCDTILSLFDQWQHLFLHQLKAHAQDPMPRIDYMERIKDSTIRRKLLTHDQLALVQLLSPNKNPLNLKIKTLDEAWNYCGTFVGKSLDRPVHIEHGPHLKANAFSRNIQNSKPHSLNEMSIRLVSNLSNAVIHLEEGETSKCLSVLQDSLRAIPNQSLTHVPLAQEKLKRGKFNEAREHAELAILADPQCQIAFELLATALFNLGDMEGAAETIKRCRSRFPKYNGILGIAHIIHAESGLLNEAYAKPNYDSMIMEATIEIDKQQDEYLRDFILHQQRLETHPPKNVPKNYYRSSVLGTLSGNAVTHLRRAIDSKVQDYIKHVAQHDEVLRASRPAKLGMACWGTVMGLGAYAAPHLHKNAWISGVYYSRIPNRASNASNDTEGCIEFGRPPEDQYRYTFPPQTRIIKPYEGMLLLFPAHYWHGTIALKQDTPRISFGFNLL